MIHSMTAFARSERTDNWGSLVCEVRSVNHRYLEISLHLPEILRVFEMPIRERIRDKIKRGKIECAVRYQPGFSVTNSLYKVNTSLAQELCNAAEIISGFVKHPAPIDTTAILRLPNVLESEEADLTILEVQLLQLIDTNLNELIKVREREGADLNQLFIQRMNSMQTELKKVRQQLPHVLIDQREKLQKRFADAKLELDPQRLEQEMVIFSQKIDVAEEIDRTETHINEIRRVLKHGGPVGRRLDFLLQELNREANTLGSKSVDPVITHAAVEMKVLIEQVREQVQNIE